MRQIERPLLGFVREVAYKQRRRGGAILGENPLRSKAWEEPDIIAAFEGLEHGRVDMCVHGLRRPDDGRYLRKPTRLAGTSEILEECCKSCPGGHAHAPVMGALKVKGKWKSVSEFAGGYTRKFSTAVVKGAEKFLEKRGDSSLGGHWSHQRVAEENFIGVEELEEEARDEAADEFEDYCRKLRSEIEDERLQKLSEERRDEDREGEGGEEKLEDQEMSKLMVLHRRLGHPANETLVRTLKLAGADKQVLQEAKRLKCSQYEQVAQPPKPGAQRSDHRPTVFNEVVHLDLKYAKDAKKELYVTLSMVDGATNYHQASLLKSRDPGHVAHHFFERWLSIFGAPREIVMDQGGEWETEFISLLEQHGILSKVSGSYAPWQNSLAERHGAILGTAWSTLIHEYKIMDRKGMKLTLQCAIQAKNQTITRRGYSAETLVFGRNSNFPDPLDDDSQDVTTLGQALSLDGQVAKQAEMRAAAKRSLLHQDAQQKLKNALQRQPRGVDRTYLPGEKIYFWVPGNKPTRYRRDPGVWRGPGIIVAQESSQKYFVSWRGRCLLLAATNLRPATVAEAEDVDKTAEELHEMEKAWQMKREAEEIPRRPREAKKDAEKRGWKTDGVARKLGRFGRSAIESRRMMKGLKSVREVLKMPKNRRVRGNGNRGPYRKRKISRPEEEDQYEPSIAPEKENSDEEFWKEIEEAEERYVEEDERRRAEAENVRRMNAIAEQKRKARHEEMSPRSRKRAALDDMPLELKRRHEEDEDAEEGRSDNKRLRASMFAYVQNVIATEDRAEILRNKAREGCSAEDGSSRANHWMRRDEVRRLARTLDMPVTAIRLHRQPRKRLHPPPGRHDRRRITVMLLQKEGEAMVSDETVNQVKEQPRRKTTMPWRGMTMFLKERRKTSTLQSHHCCSQAVIQVGNEVFAARCLDPELWKSFVRREKELEIASEALVLRLKASGKELNPRYFDEAESQAFRKSDQKEWDSWVKNQVLQRLTPAEAARVPSSMVFKAPLRMVRVNKGKDEGDLQPKSPLVIPGHLDPELGGYRTDSPTTSPIAVRLLKTLCVSENWVGWVFDVSTAFLSGKQTERVVYVKAPPEGLPQVDGMSAVAPHELLRIVKGAYGLAEAPRLWYLRAVELLEKMGMEELSFSRSTFVLKSKAGKVVAVCCMHVDDGFLAGEEGSEEYKALLNNIDKNFNIKEWKTLSEKPVSYLGMEVVYDRKNGKMTDDMTEYVKKIEEMSYEAKNEEKLGPEEVTKFRRLIMQMRWPAQHVLPEFMYVISSLAQKVTTAVGAHAKKANDMLKMMKQSAERGEAKLHYYKITGKPMIVSFFDSSLGKKEVLSAQLGEFHVITSEDVKDHRVRGNVVEYHSNKIPRVVRSSMAAEGCAMTSAADHQLLTRMIWDAFTHGKTVVDAKWRKSLITTGAVITDAKSLYDHCCKVGHMASERQTALDILTVKDMIQDKLICIYWTPTFKQLADSLTKEMDDALIRDFKRTGLLCLVQTKADEAIESQRAKIRKGQRERRNLRLKAKQPTRSLLDVKNS